MKIVALIPARTGSKRIPGKNFKSLGGKALFKHSIKTAVISKLITEVYVTTDHKGISLSKDFAFIIRPERLCQDHSTDQDVIKHFISKVKCDIIVYLRPTTPFRDVKVVDAAIDGFLKLLTCKTKPHSLRSVEEMPESAEKCFIIKDPAFLEPFFGTRRGTDKPNQQCVKTYSGNGYVDIILTRNLKVFGDLWGKTVVAFPTEPVIELDTPKQWEYAEWWIKNHG